MGKMFYLVFGPLLITISFIEANPEQRDYVYYPKTGGWLKLHLDRATWRDARLTCAQEGAVLASPENDALEQAIRNLMSKSKTMKVNTGVHDTFATGHYYSIEGTPLSSMAVSVQEEPLNASRTENCLYLTQDDTEMTRGSCLDALLFVCFTRKTPTAVDCGTDDKGYKYESRTKRCYKFHIEPKNWSEAFATCSDENSHLAVINSEVESRVFQEMYAKVNASLDEPLYEVIFVGFTDLGDHKTWMTIHGQTLKDAGFNLWHPGQPENQDTLCGAMYGVDGLLDDYFCQKTCAFICEADPRNPVTNTDNKRELTLNMV
ncbi:hemolymph lipopolysaccharide-binding protein-like [Leguminivora glycinivorella]|uniref:hemolymph lipopolysaccharide-binding protein-like n=1 Tax=Leguminivora glycinivorella TaxID=1035111 RepID=UPI0020103B68|nr:hemolymph lipopolysaccharide-binding protein-like [Leguminivora glycinivorella]